MRSDLAAAGSEALNAPCREESTSLPTEIEEGKVVIFPSPSIIHVQLLWVILGQFRSH